MINRKLTYYFFSFSCGMIDAICFAGLGGVFVRLMTGNMILLGIALGNQNPTHIYQFLLPLFFYGLGTLSGGALTTRYPSYKIRRLGFCIVWCLMLFAATLASHMNSNVVNSEYFFLLSILSFSAGLQSALLLRTGLKNFASNVMTSTLTALLVDFQNKREQPAIVLLSRMASILFFLCGAIAGAAAVTLSVYHALFLSLIPLTISVIGTFFDND